MPLTAISIQVLFECPACDSSHVYVDLHMHDQYCNACGHTWSLEAVANLTPTSMLDHDVITPPRLPHPDQSSLLPSDPGADDA